MEDLLRQGIELMLVGMGVVFSLLGLLVLAIKAMSRLAAMFPEMVLAPPISPPVVDDSELIAVITASIHAHRAGAGGRGR
jgi:oxaloacetate decarboxylase gamma subunit